MAYFRRDEERKFKEEMAIIAAGGNLREYEAKRKTLRELYATGGVKAPQESGDAITSTKFLEMAARMGAPIKGNVSGG